MPERHLAEYDISSKVLQELYDCHVSFSEVCYSVLGKFPLFSPLLPYNTKCSQVLLPILVKDNSFLTGIDLKNVW